MGATDKFAVSMCRACLVKPDDYIAEGPYGTGFKPSPYMTPKDNPDTVVRRHCHAKAFC